MLHYPQRRVGVPVEPVANAQRRARRKDLEIALANQIGGPGRAEPQLAAVHRWTAPPFPRPSRTKSASTRRSSLRPMQSSSPLLRRLGAAGITLLSNSSLSWPSTKSRKPLESCGVRPSSLGSIVGGPFWQLPRRTPLLLQFSPRLARDWFWMAPRLTLRLWTSCSIIIATHAADILYKVTLIPE